MGVDLEGLEICFSVIVVLSLKVPDDVLLEADGPDNVVLEADVWLRLLRFSMVDCSLFKVSTRLESLEGALKMNNYMH